MPGQIRPHADHAGEQPEGGSSLDDGLCEQDQSDCQPDHAGQEERSLHRVESLPTGPTSVPVNRPLSEPDTGEKERKAEGNAGRSPDGRDLEQSGKAGLKGHDRGCPGPNTHEGDPRQRPEYLLRTQLHIRPCETVRKSVEDETLIQVPTEKRGMLSSLTRLGLEVKAISAARGFYEGALALSPTVVEDGVVTYPAGDTSLALRRPTGVPRGGIHTHYALSIPHEAYDDWWERLREEHDLEEAQFGDTRSLYCYDPDGHCVELGQQDVEGPGIDGIFEVALEVTDLDRAIDYYEALGFESLGGGEPDRRRLQGPMALELWEPRLGIADARGGCHVELAFATGDLEAVSAAIGDRSCWTERRDDRLVVRDPDGHHLTFTES